MATFSETIATLPAAAAEAKGPVAQQQSRATEGGEEKEKQRLWQS